MFTSIVSFSLMASMHGPSSPCARTRHDNESVYRTGGQVSDVVEGTQNNREHFDKHKRKKLAATVNNRTCQATPTSKIFNRKCTKLPRLLSVVAPPIAAPEAALNEDGGYSREKNITSDNARAQAFIGTYPQDKVSILSKNPDLTPVLCFSHLAPLVYLE